MNTLRRTVSLAARGVGNYFRRRPYCVSFEITYRCNARCRHCHLGVPVEETLAPPERFGARCRELNPVVAQVSGGEPLLRPDVEQVIKALRVPDRAPYIVVTTNGFLLTGQRLRSLLAAGVDTFSLSLDYPDKRHDEFRRVPGLFARIERMISELEPAERRTITLACVVQNDNFRELLSIAELARRWGVAVNFSTYTWMRTQDKGYMLSPAEIPELRRIVGELLDFRHRYGNVYASEYVFARMVRFFEDGSIANCQAGIRSLIVNPDGALSPCGLILTRHDSWADMIRGFYRTNRCTACNTSSRSNSEKPGHVLLRDSFAALRRR